MPLPLPASAARCPAPAPARRRRPAGRLAAVLLAALLCGCAAPGRTGLAGPAGADGQDDAQGQSSSDGPALWLLGEVHDNAAQHRLRLQQLGAMIGRGERPALLLEQFDRGRQAEIDRLVQRAPGMPPGDAEREATADALVALGSAPGAGWDWALYRPYLLLALQWRLPIVAANVSRDEARQVIRQGLAATGFDADVPADIAQAQAGAIERSHCGQVDAALAGRMALAQVARDQFMARQVALHAGRGVLLLAGNGHVRRDLGVPRWLSPALRARSRSVGYLEADDPSGPAYDQVVRTPAQPRSDPCAGMAPVAGAVHAG